MRSKEDFYNKTVKGIRLVLSNSDNLKCTCPKTKCEWHGKCQEIVIQKLLQ
jgi:hypothetical protein